MQWNLYIIVVTLKTQPVGYYTEVACLYSGTSGHSWDTTSYTEVASRTCIVIATGYAWDIR